MLWCTSNSNLCLNLFHLANGLQNSIYFFTFRKDTFVFFRRFPLATIRLPLGMELLTEIL